MKKKSKQFTLTYLLLISFSLTSISQIYEVDMNEDLIKDYGKFTRRDSDPTKVANKLEASLEGATKIGTVYSKKYNGKKLMRKISKLGGDFYSINYEQKTFTKTGVTPSGSYTQTFGAKNDFSYRRQTTTYYKEYNSHKFGYPISIYRIFDYGSKSTKDAIEDFMKGCNYCSGVYVGPKNFEKYIAKVIDINSINYFGVPHFYYFIECIINNGFPPLRVTQESIEGEYNKLEILLKAGLNPNIIPKEIRVDFERDKEHIPLVLRYVYNYDSPLRIISKRISYIIKNLDPQNIDTDYNSFSEKELLYQRKHLEFLQKVESLLIENGARNFQAGDGSGIKVGD